MPSKTKSKTIRITGEITSPGTWFHREIDAKPAPKEINVKLNTPGGSAFTSVNWYDSLSAHPAHVTTTVQGLAASGGSIVLMAGDHRVATDGSLIMIHPPIAGAYGHADDLNKGADVLAKMEESIVRIYATRTGISPTRIKEMVRAESWLTAKEAKRLNFIDEIVPNKSSKSQPSNHLNAMQQLNAPHWAMQIAACSTTSDPATQWRAAIAEKVGSGSTHRQAVSAVTREQPELHRAYLEQANTGRAAAMKGIARQFG